MKTTRVIFFVLLITFSLSNLYSIMAKTGEFDITTSGDSFSSSTWFAKKGNYLYSLNNHGEILDVSNPNNPTNLGSIYGWENNGGSRNVYLSDNESFLYCQINSTMYVLNVDNPTTPTVVISSAINYPLLGVCGNLLFFGSGIVLEIYQLTDDNSSLKKVYNGSFKDMGFFCTLKASGDYAYLGCNNGLLVLNIADPANPVVASKFSISQSGFELNSMAIYDKYLYFAYNRDYYKLTTLDISDPNNLVQISGIDLPINSKSQSPIHSMLLDNKMLYISSQDYGVLAYDVSNPSIPAYSGDYDTPAQCIATVSLGDYLYAMDAITYSTNNSPNLLSPSLCRVHIVNKNRPNPTGFMWSHQGRVNPVSFCSNNTTTFYISTLNGDMFFLDNNDGNVSVEDCDYLSASDPLIASDLYLYSMQQYTDLIVKEITNLMNSQEFALFYDGLLPSLAKYKNALYIGGCTVWDDYESVTYRPHFYAIPNNRIPGTYDWWGINTNSAYISMDRYHGRLYMRDTIHTGTSIYDVSTPTTPVFRTSTSANFSLYNCEIGSNNMTNINSGVVSLYRLDETGIPSYVGNITSDRPNCYWVTAKWFQDYLILSDRAWNCVDVYDVHDVSNPVLISSQSLNWPIEKFDGSDLVLTCASNNHGIVALNVCSLLPIAWWHAPENVEVSVVNDTVTIKWDSVPAAQSYGVYADTDINGSFNTDVTASGAFTTDSEGKIVWTAVPSSGSRQFYKITAKL